MACERSCSVTLSDRRVMSHYHSFVIMLGGAGAWRNVDAGLELDGARNRGGRNGLSHKY